MSSQLLADFFVVVKCVNNQIKNKLADPRQPVLVIFESIFIGTHGME